MADFCADLRRRWRASGRDLPSLARDVRISRTQLYAILNGEIKRPPDWDTLVRPLIEACDGGSELAEWRQRYEVLVRVYDELGRRQAPAGDGAAATTPPSQLPAEVAEFTGRAAELVFLDTTPPGGTVIVTGMPGVGKTALAVHWGHRAASRFPDGRLYADLRGFHGSASPTDPTDVIRQFLDAFGLPPEAVPDTLDAQTALFRSLTAERRMLVLLDNARDAGQVGPLLPAGRAVTTIITSRRPFTALIAETGARPVVLRPLAAPEAAELLLRRVDPAVRDDAAAEAIAAACGGLPLALALVAARAGVTGFGLDVLAAQLRRAATRLGALGDGALRSVFAWSYNSLSPPAARLFRLLGSVSGTEIAIAAAAALAGRALPDTTGMLRELTEAGLLSERAPGRFVMHDLIRVYAAEAARATGATGAEDGRQDALTRLLDHYTHHAYHAERVLNPTRAPIPLALGAPAAGVALPEARADVQAARAWLESEREALLDALRQAKDEGLDRHAWQLGWALDTFLNEQRRWHEEGAAWAVAVSAANALTDRVAAAYAISFLAVVEGRLRQFEEAHDHVRHALELIRAAGDRPAEAECRFTLSYVCWLQGDHEAALHQARSALDLFAGLHSPAWEGKAARAVGWYHANLGEHREALSFYGRALQMQQRSDDRANEAITRNCLGLLYQQIGDQEHAMEHYRSGLEHARALGDDVLRAELLARLGDVYESFTETADAREYWEEAHLILAELGHPQAADVRHKLESSRPGN